MAAFTDRKGTEWVVRLDAELIEEVRQRHGVDLLAIGVNPLHELKYDVARLVAVIYMVCRDQIRGRRLKAEAFAELLPYPPRPMLLALLEAIVEQFPTKQQGAVRARLEAHLAHTDRTDELTERQVMAKHKRKRRA